MSKRDVRLVAGIMAQLEKGGPLRDYRPLADRSAPLADHVRREVQRTIDRVRRLQTFEMPAGYFAETGQWVELPRTATTVRYRKASKTVLALGYAALADHWAEVQVTPHPRANALKHRCATEAFDLMAFSAQPPTGVAGRPFRTITAMLYEAVTGEPHTDVDTERACNAVLRDRRKLHPQAFCRL